MSCEKFPIFLLLIHSIVISDCPVTYMQHKRSCFRVYDFPASRDEAQLICEDDGQAWFGKGQLAKLNDMSKVDTIHGLMNG